MDNINSNLNTVNLDFITANESQFFLNVRGVPDDTLTVLDFSCSENEISHDYIYKINILIESKINPIDIIGKKAKFDMLWDADKIHIHGICSSFYEVGAINNGEEYVLEISSPMSVLRNNQKNRVFLNKDIKMIIDEILLDVGFQASDYQLMLTATYPIFEYMVQYNENDFDFLTRQMSYHGIYFRFEHSESKVKVLFHDNINDIPMLDGPNELMYQERSGQVRSVETVSSIREQADLLASEIVLKDYNYRTPESDLTVSSMSKSEISSVGILSYYGSNYQTVDHGAYLSEISQQALEWRRQTFVADTDCRGLVPGVKFTLTDHPNKKFNGDYLVVAVEALGSQRHSITADDTIKSKTYSNRVLLIKAGIDFRAKIEKKLMKNGNFSTIIESTGGDYAYLDDQGRYRMRVPFDLSDRQVGDASHSVRLMQLSSGQGYGMHFPLHSGTEVLMSCVNGDINRPVLLGMISNPDTPSPVTSANVSQNTLRTWAGNELTMDDTTSSEFVAMHTKDKNNILILSAKQDSDHVHLATELGEMEIYADTTLLVECGDSISTQSGNDNILEIDKSQQLVAKQKGINQQSATDILLHADKNILIDSDENDINISCSKDITTKIKSNYSLDVKQENLELLIPTGKFSVNAGSDITFAAKGGGPIFIGQASGKIEITNSGGLSLDGPNIIIKSSAINIKAGSVGGN